MSRLPIPGNDDSTWGDILNDFLRQSHNTDGSLKDNSVTAASIAPAAINEVQLSAEVQAKLNNLGSVGIPISEKAVANGVATLDLNGKVLSSQSRPFNNRGPIAAFTTYNPWDLTIYRGRRIVFINQVVTSAAPITFISAANYVSLEPEARFHAADYGSLTGSNAQVAINAALQEAYNMTTGSEVVLPEGIFSINAPVEIPWGCTLVGAGKMSTILTLADNSNCEMIRMHISTGSGNANAAFAGIRDIGLNGRKATQVGSACHGILVQTSPVTTAQTGTSGNHQEWFDPHHAIENVAIRSCLGDGLHMVGRSSSHIRNVWTDSCDGYGIYGTFDTTFVHCETQQSGLSGYYFSNGSIRAIGCKSYLNGRLDHIGAGFEITSNGNFASMVGCDSQNNRGPGYSVTNARSVNINGTADGNGLIEAGSTPAPAVSLVGCTGAIISVGAINSPQNGVAKGNQNYGLYMTGCTKSIVTITNSAISPATILGDLDPSSNISGGNDVRINGVSLTNQLSFMTDVAFVTPVDGQVPIYNSATSKWNNGTPGVASAFAVGIFGDGSDGGTIILDGTTPTMPSGTFLTRTGNTYTLTRDVNAGSNFTVSSGMTLLTNGCKIYCLGTISIQSGASVTVNGNDGNANGTAGAASAAGSIGGSLAGGAGNTGNGTSGGTGTNAARHGVGGGGGGGAGASGTAGSGTFAGFAGTQFLRTVQAGISSAVPYAGQLMILSGAPGGGGGGGDGTNKGGGGGAGGGVFLTISRNFSNAGTISVRGGNGATPTIGNCGGGGGGGGGLALVYTLYAWTNTGTFVVSGGTGGAGVGTGASGTNGAGGSATNIIVQ
jgi:hypothetical protein